MQNSQLPMNTIRGSILLKSIGKRGYGVLHEVHAGVEGNWKQAIDTYNEEEGLELLDLKFKIEGELFVPEYSGINRKREITSLTVTKVYDDVILSIMSRVPVEIRRAENRLREIGGFSFYNVLFDMPDPRSDIFSRILANVINATDERVNKARYN